MAISNLLVRKALLADRQQLANLIHFELHVHRHLDWRPPLDWLGHQPYVIFEREGRPQAALACPPDPPHVAWIRLFVAASHLSPQAAWESLWPEALHTLANLPSLRWVAAIPLQSWFRSLLESSGFQSVDQVVMLNWERNNRLPDTSESTAIRLRPMNYDDLDAVEAVDSVSFEPIWRNSRTGLELAFRQAAVATVAEADDRMVGYQISTATSMGGHLARLAVVPDLQGHGVGFSLVRDLLSQFIRRGAHSVTVNTQQDNSASLSLYQKAGFRLSGEKYPVYQYGMDH